MPGTRLAACTIDNDVFNLAHAQPVHMLIVILSVDILYISVFHFLLLVYSARKI